MSLFQESQNARRSISAIRSMQEDLARLTALQNGADIPVQPEPPEPELSTIQLVALLRMAGPHATICRGVADHLQSEPQDRPSARDYAALKDFDLCEVPEGERWHKLTPPGRVLAHTLAARKAKELSLHIFVEGMTERKYKQFFCACGHWRGGFYRSSTGEMNAYAKWCAHVERATEKA